MIACQAVGLEDVHNELQSSFANFESLDETDAREALVMAAPLVRGSPTMVLILDEARDLLLNGPGQISAFRVSGKYLVGLNGRWIFVNSA